MNTTLLIQSIGGFLLLLIGAEILVRGASDLAGRFGISPLIIGLTVVAFGTSAPELAVSVKSSLSGQGDLALGNVVGSNILNVLLILGLSALIAPMLVSSDLIRRDVPLLIIASTTLFLMALDGHISRIDGTVLFLAVLIYTVATIITGRAEAAKHQSNKRITDAEPSVPHMPIWQSLVAIALGLGLLVLGADWLVKSAVELARLLGISELLIGLTIVAVGTSLPEIATSLVAAFRGMRDMAVGNVVGSCLFNILAVAGIASVVSPSGLSVAASLLAFDLPVMLATAVACLPIFMTGHKISRGEGALFIFYYVAYTTYLVLASSQHAVLELMNTTMLGFVIPLTVITLVILAVRERGIRTPLQ